MNQLERIESILTNGFKAIADGYKLHDAKKTLERWRKRK